MSKTYIFMNDTPPPRGFEENKREVYFPAGATDHYDPALRRTFQSRRQMRLYMARHQLRDAGERLNVNKPLGGTEGSTRRTSRGG